MSSLATRKARSRVPCATEPGASSLPTTERCFWTRWRRFLWTCRPSYSAFCRRGEYERVGEERTRKVNVRIIAATNRDLKQEVDAGRFRQDLYYRLNVFPIDVPPLRRRREDIPPLASHFLKRAAAKLKRPRPALTQRDALQLQNYDWPGNVRELQNVIERAMVTARSGVLQFTSPLGELHTRLPDSSSAPAALGTDVGIVLEAEMRARERENILAALRRAEGRISGPQGAAELLGVNPSTLASRIKKLGLLLRIVRDEIS